MNRGAPCLLLILLIISRDTSAKDAPTSERSPLERGSSDWSVVQSATAGISISYAGAAIVTRNCPAAVVDGHPLSLCDGVLSPFTTVEGSDAAFGNYTLVTIESRVPDTIPDAASDFR